MKNVKRFIAALMATVVVATLSGISAFATKTYPGVEDASDLGVGTYLCFGDSIATGYLSEQSGEDFKSINIAQTLRDGETTTNAYPTMIADALGLDVPRRRTMTYGPGTMIITISTTMPETV